VLDDILAAAKLTRDTCVIEVGPGLGVLTRELAVRAGWVVAVELDEGLAALLQRELGGCGNLRVVREDVLKTEPSELLAQTGRSCAGYRVIATCHIT